MKLSTMYSRLFATLLAIAGLAVSGLVRAQDPSGQTDLFGPPHGVSESQPTKNSPYGRYWASGGTISSGRSGPNPASAIRKAAEAVRDAKGEEGKSAAQKKLTELLSKCYDDDMVQREHELKQIEERLTKLRELLDRRRTKKQEIVDLQTKVALNEAEGLGFYDSERPAKGGDSSFSIATPHPLIKYPAAGPTSSQIPR